MSEIEVVLPSGESARAVAWGGGDVLSLICPSAFAPGQPVELKASSEHSTESITVVGKSGGSKRRPDGAFDVRLRLHSLRREQRAWLDEAFRAP
jgi:hypothetical protein